MNQIESNDERAAMSAAHDKEIAPNLRGRASRHAFVQGWLSGREWALSAQHPTSDGAGAERMREVGDLMAERLLSLIPDPRVIAWKCDDCGRRGTNDHPLPEHSDSCSVGQWLAIGPPRQDGALMRDAWDRAVAEHEAKLQRGVRVRVVLGECPPGPINGCLGHFPQQHEQTGTIVSTDACTLTFTPVHVGRRRMMTMLGIDLAVTRGHRFKVEYDAPIRLDDLVASTHGDFCAAELIVEPLPGAERAGGGEE